MKVRDKANPVIVCILLAGFLCGSCAFNQTYIQTKNAEKAEIIEMTGSYTALLFGANYAEDIATVAILAPTDGQYAFDIYAPDWTYRIVKGVSGKDAVAMAEKFVHWHSSYLRTQMSKIIAPGGKVIGYEIRPLYMSTTFGRTDVMDIGYFLRADNKIEVHVHLYDDVQMKFMGGDGGQNSGH